MILKKKQMEKQLQQLQIRLKELPEGKIICSGKESNCKWFQSDGHNKVYIHKKDRELAEKLAVKKYLLFLMEDLEQERKAINAYLKYSSQRKGKAETLLTESSEFKNLLSPYFAPLSKELDDWMKSPYEHNLKYPEHLLHKISADEFVRSKSEAMIGKMLRNNNVPFRYESKLLLNNIALYPDFTIRHPKSGEYFYWEHFGRVDDPAYVKNMYSKLQLYTANHIFPSINLITTYETKNKPLTFEMVEMLVNYYFL